MSTCEWPVCSAIGKEALLTSQIEGTQAALTDLFDDEAGQALSNTADVEEVSIRAAGDWEGWVGFFLAGVEAAASDAERGIVAIASLVNADRKRLLAAPRVGAVALRLFELLPVMPRLTIEQVRQRLDTTFPAATAAVKLLQDLGMLTELTGQKNPPIRIEFEPPFPREDDAVCRLVQCSGHGQPTTASSCAAAARRACRSQT